MKSSLSSKWSPVARALVAIPALGLGVLSGTAQADVGDTATWLFNIPATSTSSITGPSELAATLVGTETATGVSFVLTPNASSSGMADAPGRTFVERLTFVYSGPTGTGLPSLVDPAPGSTLTMKVNDGAPPLLQLDAGYKTAYNVLTLDWGSKAVTGLDTASWQLNGAGVDLKDFLYPAVGTANNKPSPIFGVISLTAYDLDGSGKAKPTPSNWVAMQVPEPGSTGMLLAGLSVLSFIGRRRRV